MSSSIVDAETPGTPSSMERENPKPTHTSGSWSRIKELFEQAVDLEPSQRSAWIEQACNGDRKVRAELVSLLEYDDPSDAFLETPIESSSENQIDVEADSSRLTPGSRISRGPLFKSLVLAGWGKCIWRNALARMIRAVSRSLRLS
jgi:hypothetical protein